MSTPTPPSTGPWKPEVRPSPDVCPRAFCFLLVEAGTGFAPGPYANLDEGLASAGALREDTCTANQLTGSPCRRMNPEHGTTDWYELVEPWLEEAGLPWFYFVSSADKVHPAKRAEYLRDSRKLWGDAADGE